MQTADVLILALYLLAVLALSWHCRHDSAGADGHFLAGRRMGTVPIGLSVMVTSFSAINYLAIPEEICGHGLYVIVSFPVFFLAAWPITRLWMPFFHSLRVTTVYEFLEQRYDRRVRRLASGIFLLWRAAWMAIALYVSGKYLAVLTGTPPLPMIALCGLVAAAYTALGGMRAVMWTDVLQFAVLLLGLLFGVIYAFSTADAPVLDTVASCGRFRPFTPFDPQFLSFDPRIRMTFWSGLFGVFTAFMARYGADQVVMQRYFTARDLASARRGLWLNAAVSVATLSLLALFGIAVCAYAVRTGAIHPDQPVPRGLALKQLAALLGAAPAGLTGLITAGLLAATMSSVDSGINACAAAVTTDFLQGRPAARPRRLTLALGLAVTALAILLLPWLNAHQSLFAVINKLVNGLGSPLLAIVTLGMFSRRTTAHGMFWGGLLGTALSLTVSLAVQSLALQYYAVVNLLLSLAACALCSWLIPQPKTTP